MTQEEFQNKVEELRDSLVKTTEEYIESNKQYNNGDILKISFTKNEKNFVYKCMIMNIYLKPDMVFMSTTQWPTPTILYFARNCWKNENGVIEVGGHCPLGYLEGSENICGHIGVDMDTLKIEVINMNEL